MSALPQPEIEPFIDAEAAGDFLSLTAQRVIRLARTGQLPGHPLGAGRRKQWRFRKSELANAIVSGSNSASHPHPRSAK